MKNVPKMKEIFHKFKKHFIKIDKIIKILQYILNIKKIIMKHSFNLEHYKQS